MDERDPFADLPTLIEGVVRFETVADFTRHFNAFMRHAALLVRSDPIDVGQRRRLVLRVEEIEVTVPLHASVQYRKDHLVGFSIDGFADLKESLQRIADKAS